MSNKLKFAVEDIHLLEDDSIDKSQFSLLRVDAFATGKSLHDTYVTEETLRKTASTILQKPFVFVIDERFSDLGTHDNKEIAGGFVPHNSRLDFKQLPDGRLMLSVDVLIWRRYSNNLVEYFERDGGRKGVSVEIEVLESRKDETNGLLEICNFVYAAITGLGDMIQSAIPNAEAVMAFAKEFEEDKNKFEFSSKYENLDFSIPKPVKNNANKSLEKHKDSGSRATSVDLAVARHLVKNDVTTHDRIRQINKKFSGANADEIIHGMYGGNAGKKWAETLYSQIEELDKKKLSYYSEEENMADFAKEDLGKGEALKIDKSKDKMSETPWGNVNKTSLRNKILNASNYSSLVKDVYMLVNSGWEDAPSEDLRYPVMEIKDGTLVYNRYGLSAALQRAEGQNESSVVSKVKGIYEKMGLDKPNKENKSKEAIDKMAKDKVDTAKDEEKETPDEEKNETPEEQKKEKEKGVEKKFSYAEIFGTEEEFAKLFADDEDDDEDTKEKFSKAKEEFGVGENPATMMHAMFAKMCQMAKKVSKMADDSKVYMAENEDLKKRFAEIEKGQKEFAVTSTLKELSDSVVIPEDKLTEMKTEAEKYSLAELDGWKNYAKALCFDFKAKKSKGKDEEEDITKYALPWNNVKVEDSDDVWAMLNK